jgi:hypothetical protein
MIPNINPNVRGRTQPKRGRKPLFDPAILAERFRTIERVFAWEDKFRRLLLRFDRLSQLFLPDRVPGYISWEQYQRYQAQLRSNRAAVTGPPRAGQALLSGLLVCGRCGLRMAAQYNNNGANPRYACGSMDAEGGTA